MLNVVLDEKVQVGAKVRKNKVKQINIPLGEAMYDQLEQLDIYDESIDVIATELIREGLDYAYMDDIPVQEYHEDLYNLISVELPFEEHRLLNSLAKKHGCTVRKMGYTILNFMIKAQQ